MKTTKSDNFYDWNTDAGPRWARHATALDCQLAPFSRKIFECSRFINGGRVIDIGCGACGMTLEIANRVAPGGKVLGVDLSVPLLSVAGSRIAATHAENLETIAQDAETYAFEIGSFDHVVSRFGWMFFNDSLAALQNIRKALCPGGRLNLVCWGPRNLNPWLTVSHEAIADIVELPTPDGSDEPGPFRFSDTDRLQPLLEASGFVSFEIRPLTGQLQVGGTASLKELVAFAMEIGPASKGAREADEPTRQHIRERLHETFAPLHRDDGVHLDYHAWQVTACNPS